MKSDHLVARSLRFGVGALAAFALAHTAGAQGPQPAGWPANPVRMMVPAGAGTAPDIIARVVGDKLSRIWGQPVIIDNKPGAGGVIGMTAVKNAERDSHGFVFTPAFALTTTQYMYRPAKLDIARDFSAVALVGVSPMMAVVRADSPFNTLADVIKQARRDPDHFVVATTSHYTVPHLTAALLAKAAGVPLRSVPFTASSQSVSAVVNGDAQLVLDGIPPLDGMIKGGRLKAIAIFSEERLPKRPQLATVSETYPGLAVNGWFGIVAPAGTQARAIERVNRDIATVLALPDVIERLETLGVYPRPMDQTQFADFWRKERQRWEQVLRDIGAQPLKD